MSGSHLIARTAALAILAAFAVLVCEPSGLAGWLKAVAGAVLIPLGVYATIQVATGQWRLP